MHRFNNFQFRSSSMIVNIMCIINYVGNYRHFTISPTFAGRNGFLIWTEERSKESSSLKTKRIEGLQ